MKPLPKAPFGRTGHMSTRTLFGAAAFFDVDQITADRTMDLLMDWGVNHIDTAASYGKAEKRLGPWLKHNRKDVFLATKTEERTYRGAREELHRSLELMNVDSVDLWQMHVLIRQDEWQTAMGEGGALEAFIEARGAGTGEMAGSHGPWRGGGELPCPQPGTLRFRQRSATLELAHEPQCRLCRGFPEASCPMSEEERRLPTH
jgi:aryl-alcohol dehydrogenase-like predicted oxidoreductase